MRSGCATVATKAAVKRARELADIAIERRGQKSVAAHYVTGLAFFASGDAQAACTMFESGSKLQPSPETTLVRDALVRLRMLERDAIETDAGTTAAKLRDHLEIGIANRDACTVEDAMRELFSIISKLPHEMVMSLKLGKLAAAIQKSPPSSRSQALATDFIVELRK